MVQITERRMTGLIVNNDLEKMWKKASVASFEMIFSHFPRGTEEHHDSPVG
jgi:hypothetical protein